MMTVIRTSALLLILALAGCDGSVPDNVADNVDEMGFDDSLNTGDLSLNTGDLNVGLEEASNVVEPPACAEQPASGERLAGEQLSGRGHELHVDNGTSSHAIVKLRTAGDRRLVTSFFVPRGSTGSISGIPDGNYRIQYALGATLAEDCRSFIRIDSAGEFEGDETLVTEREEVEDGVRFSRARLTYTLHPVEGGTERPQPIDPSAFNAD